MYLRVGGCESVGRESVEYVCEDRRTVSRGCYCHGKAILRQRPAECRQLECLAKSVTRAAFSGLDLWQNFIQRRYTASYASCSTRILIR